MEIDFLKTEELVYNAALYTEYTRVLLDDSDIDKYLTSDDETIRLMLRKTALTKFSMLQEFSTRLNKHISELEDYISELSKQYTKQFKEQVQNDKRNSGINN